MNLRAPQLQRAPEESSAEPIPLLSSVDSIPPSKENSPESVDLDRIKRDRYTRIIFNANNIGNGVMFGKAVSDLYQSQDASSDEVNEEVQTETVIDGISGLVIGSAINYVVPKKRSLGAQLNPTHRKYSTLSKLGSTVGSIFANSNVVPVQQSNTMILVNAATAFFSVIFGLLPILYDYIRGKSKKSAPAKESEKSTNHKLGNEGWTSYGFIFNKYGAALGQVIGVGCAYFLRTGYNATMYLVGGIAGVSSFIVGLIAVPLINRFFNKRLITSNSDKFRSNYVMTGFALGSALGSIAGFVFDLYVPGLGSILAMTFFGAVGSVLGGACIGAKGESITQKIKQKFFPDQKSDENSWDYTSRTVSGFFASVGGVIGFFLPIPGGAAVGALVGAAVGGVVGWFAGIYTVKKARELVPNEKKSHTLPWTQRVGAGNTLFSIIGGAIGLVVGLLGGPLGCVLGATLGAAIGGVLGGVIGALYDKTTRDTLKCVGLASPSVSEATTPSVSEQVTPTVSPTSQSSQLEILKQITTAQTPRMQTSLPSSPSSNLVSFPDQQRLSDLSVSPAAKNEEQNENKPEETSLFPKLSNENRLFRSHINTSLSDNRHMSARAQQEYDKQFGLIVVNR